MEGTTDDLSEWVCHYGSLYGPQIILLATLSAMTIYRREMSCNHCYAETSSRGDHHQDNNELLSRHEWNEIEAENLLDGVGLYYSGASLLPVMMHLLCVWKETDLSPICSCADATEEMLEHAGNFLSGEPLASALLGLSYCSSSSLSPPRALKKTPQVSSACFLTYPASSSSSHALLPQEEQFHHYELFADYLPPDLQIQVCAFLSARDVVRFAQVNRACRATVETTGTTTTSGCASAALWKALFDRDFGWTVTAWDVGRRARAQSLETATTVAGTTYDKEFYFRFGLAFCDYVLAGQNTAERCLVGLGGHVYDMTGFVDAHPGSPETVMVSAGKDATQFFANVRHSIGALRFAKTLCVVVDGSRRRRRVDDIAEVAGMFPTCHTELREIEGRDDVDASKRIPNVVDSHVIDLQELRMSSPIRTDTLHWIREAFLAERQEAQQRVRRSLHAREPRLTDMNVYYDPFTRSWKAWYTNPQMETVFLSRV